jgi:plastocyanin domain-containing protein
MSALTTIDLLVLAGGLGAIAWVLWYFFLAERPAAVAAPNAEVTVVVRGGYEPSTIRVKAGAPVRLVFDRQETSGCSEEVVFPAFGLKRFLPAHERTTLELTPPAPGTYEFTCGMSMLRGRVIAE